MNALLGEWKVPNPSPSLDDRVLRRSSHRALTAGLAVGLTALALAAYYRQRPPDPSPPAFQDRALAPDFTLKDVHGADLQLSDFRGRVVLLNFWATWCKPCEAEIPVLVEFHKKFRGRGFAVIGVSMDEDGWQTVTPFLERHGVNYPIAIGDEQVAQRYGVEKMPITLLIDRAGRIAARHEGVVSRSTHEDQILKLLGK
ncbi:MAG: TlpA disulfide reductase family protein [Bryobacteraceae bacterium]